MDHALRTCMLLRQLADHGARAHPTGDEARLAQRADALERQADGLRRTVMTDELAVAHRK